MPKAYYKEINIDDEYLLNLTGIRALHPADGTDSTFEYKVIPDEFTNQVVVVSMRSKYFSIFNVLIDMKYRKLTNQQIISTGLEKRVSERCLKVQVAFAAKESFSHISISAARADLITTPFGIPLIGYKVFGKYGYVMISRYDAEQFIVLMQENGIVIYTINEIYRETTIAMRAREIWNLRGDTWLGRFTLAEPSDSRRILKALT